MKKYEYILFDADNTLFDFRKAEYLSFRHTSDMSGLKFSDGLMRTYSDINDILWKELEKGTITLDFLKTERFRRLLVSYGEDDGEETNRRACEMRDVYMDTLSRQTCLIDGAAEICRTLSQKYKLYIVTNGISMIQRSRFGNSCLREYFRDIFVSEEIGYAKPKKEYYDFVLSSIGDCDKSKYLAIGDSLSSDCDGAIAYGIDICRYNPDSLPDMDRVLTYDIKNLNELNEIL